MRTNTLNTFSMAYPNNNPDQWPSDPDPMDPVPFIWPSQTSNHNNPANSNMYRRCQLIRNPLINTYQRIKSSHINSGNNNLKLHLRKGIPSIGTRRTNVPETLEAPAAVRSSSISSPLRNRMLTDLNSSARVLGRYPERTDYRRVLFSKPASSTILI